MTDFHFYHSVEVRYGDLDPQGHVNNAKHLTYFEQARIQYWVDLGLFRKDQSFMEIGVIVADIHIAYHAPILWQTPLRSTHSNIWRLNVTSKNRLRLFARVFS